VLGKTLKAKEIKVLSKWLSRGAHADFPSASDVKEIRSNLNVTTYVYACVCVCVCVCACVVFKAAAEILLTFSSRHKTLMSMSLLTAAVKLVNGRVTVCEYLQVSHLAFERS
jgi:hypothetical protein